MMTEKAFECIICFDVCRKCINCTSCHQILCKKHIKKFRDDRCPSCRTSPFQYQENIALQRIIEQAFPKEEKLDKKKAAKKRKKESTAFTIMRDAAGAIESTEEGTERSEDIGRSSPILLPSLEWAQESLLVFDDPPIFDDNVVEPTPDIPQVYYSDMLLDSVSTLGATESDDTNTIAPPQTSANDNPGVSSSPYDIRDYGTKIRRLPPHEDEFRKIPNATHLATMKSHVRNCNHQGCITVWKGPWGRFIGGDNGREYFDLTRCREGKRLNKMIGWKYNDPRS